MVGEDGKGIFSPSQIVLPVGKGFHDCKKFSFINVIISFSGCEGSGVVCNWM